jgi:hypothetical protein
MMTLKLEINQILRIEKYGMKVFQGPESQF